MNGYIGFYNGDRVEIHADSLYAAKVQAVEHFAPPKSKVHMVHVALAEVNGEAVVHVAVD